MANFPNDILSNVDIAQFPQSKVTGNPEEKKESLYKARLTVEGAGGNSEVFETWLDESFSMNVSSSWGDAFSGSFLADSLPGQPIIKGLEAMGLPTNIWIVNLQKWQGSSPIDISMPFHFKPNETDSADEAGRNIALKARNLAGYVLPREENGMLIPPGPFISDEIKELSQAKDTVNNIMGSEILKSGDKLSLEIGEFLIFKPVILKSVNLEYSNQFDHLGYPLGINAIAEISTVFVGTRKYFKSFFTKLGN